MRNYGIKIFAILMLTGMVSGCVGVSTKSGLPPAPQNIAPVLTPAESLPPYRLQVGDVIDIKLMLNPELNEQVAIRPDGMVSTTVSGDVKGYGRTVEELKKDLENQYSRLLTKPTLGVLVRSFAPNRVYVTGEVLNPGEFITIGPNLTLLQAIARAGGIKDTAGPENIVILRRGASEKPEALAANYNAAVSGRDPASDVRLAAYDVVYVPRSGIGNAHLNFDQFFGQFISTNLGANYSLNNKAVVR
jgi:polysaccharide biosynthesis/export protein